MRDLWVYGLPDRATMMMCKLLDGSVTCQGIVVVCVHETEGVLGSFPDTQLSQLLCSTTVH